MKKAMLVFLTMFFIPEAHTQIVIEPVWGKTEFGSVDNLSEAWGIDVDEDGNVYWAFNANNLGQGLDLTCYKYDSEGQEIWNSPFFFGGPGTQQSYIINASDTALYIGGRECAGFTNSCDMLLLKIDKGEGDLIWDRTLNFSGNGYDEIDGLVLKEDGIYCGGWAHELEAGSFKADMGFWKLDYSGNTIWTNYFGQAGSAEHQDGHFVVDDNYIYAAGLWNGRSAFNLYNGHALLGKFDKSTGDMVDTVLFGSQSNNFLDIENALGMTGNGDFLYLTGYTTPVVANDWQIFVAKYDKDLNQIWYTDWGGEGAESARGITVDNGIIYVAGLSSSSSIMSGGNRDAVLLKLDDNGDVISYETWGDSLRNAFRDIYVKDNSIYLSGTTEIDSLTNQKSAFLLKVNNNSVGVQDVIEDKRFSFKVYPNPSFGKINILFDNKPQDNGKISITDIQGQLITKVEFDKNDKVIDLAIDEKGIFFVTVDNGKIRTTKKIVNKQTLRFAGDGFKLDLKYQAKAVTPKIEFIEVTDKKLKRYWPNGATRIVFGLNNLQLKGENELIITKAKL